MKFSKIVVLFSVAASVSLAVVFTIGLERARSFAAGGNAEQSLRQAQSRKPVQSRKDTVTERLRELLGPENLSLEAADLAAAGSRNLRVRLSNRRPAASSFFGAEAYVAEAALAAGHAMRSGLRAQRALELSPTLILTVSVDRDGNVLWWSTQPDPFLIRTETANEAGRLQGGTVYRETADLLTSIPDDDRIAEIRLYQPLWDGERYTLWLISKLEL